MSAVLQDPVPHLRRMLKEDMAAVMTVEHRAYEHPWTEGIMRDCLRVGYRCWVCELANDLVGHAVMSVGAGEAHLLNLCISPGVQGKGYGRRLLRKMLRVAGDADVDTVFLEVRDSNHAARALYESEGFGEIGRRGGYYPDGADREDAIVYAKAIL